MLGKKNRIDGKAYSLKLQLKDGTEFLECARFKVEEKKADGKFGPAKDAGGHDLYVTDVSGDLFRITTRVFEHDQGPIRSFNVGFRDSENNEAYFTDIGLGNGVGRSLANSILNLKSFDNVELGLYVQKKEDKTYPAGSVRQGGKTETVKWAYTPATGLPLHEELKGRGGKLEKDFTNQEVFLFDKLAEFGKTLEKTSAATSTKPTSESAPANTEAASTSDIPF